MQRCSSAAVLVCEHAEGGQPQKMSEGFLPLSRCTSPLAQLRCDQR
jgi:hypothetical protein